MRPIVKTVAPYWKTGAMAAGGVVGDGPLFLIDYVLRFMRVALLLAIWRTLFQGRPAMAGVSLGAVLTYTLVSEVFADPLSGVTGLAAAFWDGSIATRFLRPMNVFGQFAAEAGGQWAFSFLLFSAPLLCCASLFGVSPFPASPLAAILFVVSLGLGVLVGYALDYISGALAIGLELTPYTIERARRAVAGVLSGAIIPFALMPWSIGKALMWSPFAALASAPLQIYIGKGDARILLASQAFWVIVLWPLAGRLWAKMRERMISYGG